MPVPDTSIGGISVMILDGSQASKPMREDLLLTRRPAVDGVTALKLGARGVPFRIRTYRDAETLVAAKAREDDFIAMNGTVVALKEPDGDTVAVLVRSVVTERVIVHGALGWLYAAPAYVVYGEWELERV